MKITKKPSESDIKKIEIELEESKTLLRGCLEEIDNEYDDIIGDVAVIGIALDRMDKVFKNGELFYLLELVDNIRKRLVSMNIEMIVIQDKTEEGM